MEDNSQGLSSWINRNKGKFIGLLAGLILGLLVLLIGILKTIIILVFALIGLYLGYLWDGGKGLENIFKKINR
ncbi:MAG: DUF2273 domain-containing protein [Halanaerobiales bacterium]|nr:DUF2273 domain-containing protein [Halanaerobiales bacterium]